MIVITGAAGFVGSCLLRHLNDCQRSDLILVDDFSPSAKRRNWENTQYLDKIAVNDFFDWACKNVNHIDFIVHLGAQTDNSITNYDVFKRWNVEYSQRIWSFAAQNRIPLIYASSAETYGDGSSGCRDDESLLYQLRPLTPCGRSKHEFDLWVKKQSLQPPVWYGLKFFSVFGPHEEHKGCSASVVSALVGQICKEQSPVVTLPQKADGSEPLFDFVYVKDVVTVLTWFMNHLPPRGIFNLGTAYPRPLSAVANAAFSLMRKSARIEFVMADAFPPSDIAAGVCADLAKLRSVGYKKSFYPLEKSLGHLVRTAYR